MKKFLSSLLFLVALGASSPGGGQETLNPIPIGGSQTTTVQNGQTLRLSAAGLTAELFLTECSPSRVAGYVRRTSGGTTTGVVTITWVERDRTIMLSFAIAPEVLFGMEGGEGDKKSGDLSESP